MKIPYKSPQHKRIVDLVTSCIKLSHKYMSQRHEKWEKADKMDRAFIDVSETDGKGKKKNPFERQLYIPMSRANKDAVLSYYMSGFTGKRPIFAINGRGPEDVRAAKMNEIILDYQAERQRLVLSIYNFVNDVLKYGLGNIKSPFTRQ